MTTTDAKREYQRKWRAANPEYKREYRAANQEHINEYQRKWRAANPDRTAEYARRYSQRGRRPGYAREYQRKWYAANQERISEQQSEYRARNLDYFRRHSLRNWERLKKIPSPHGGQPWTPAEDAVVMRDELFIVEMCYMLGRSYRAVVARRKKLRDATPRPQDDAA